MLENIRPDFRAYMAVRLFTALRTGEVHGLKWQYVGFERRIIQVRESLVAGEMTDTKTNASYRDIPMSPQVYAALRDQERRTKGMEFVFCNIEGNPLSIQNVTSRVWRPCLNMCSIPYRRLYQTRHTAATLWLAAGENIMWVSKMLGHSDHTVTLQKYISYIPDITRRDRPAFDALIERTLGNEDSRMQEEDS